ncbi:hypothetical protein HFN01_32435 [Rhizobium leguminosarum]|uniref:hypothetical protein n=1 Tax=Rhizobium leguminosarum TaxID=384 RepID=UPI001C9689B4|nr:hypothetical protein [Rhizobium leguminosarum]MBY5399510.1 hypothetical protein [Rhizobium leguminosarum]
MDIVISQQGYETSSKTRFSAGPAWEAAFIEASQQPRNGKLFNLSDKEDCTMLQTDYVRGFEDRISPYPELQAWLVSQRSKTFTYEETVLQCIFAIEYECLIRTLRADIRYVWLLLLAESYSLLTEGMALRCPSYGTFRKRVRSLETVRASLDAR